MGQKNARPIITRNPAPEWSGKPKKSPHEVLGNTDGESPDHDRRISSRQTLGHI